MYEKRPVIGRFLLVIDIIEQMKKFLVITLFPEMFDGVFNSSMMWKAQKDSLVQLDTLQLRDFGVGPRQQVDDTVYGGGDGMLLKPEPLFAAVKTPRRQILPPRSC